MLLSGPELYFYCHFASVTKSDLQTWLFKKETSRYKLEFYLYLADIQSGIILQGQIPFLNFGGITDECLVERLTEKYIESTRK